jgi:hypothetical protein
MCVCMCVCARARVRACVYARVCASVRLAHSHARLLISTLFCSLARCGIFVSSTELSMRLWLPSGRSRGTRRCVRSRPSRRATLPTAPRACAVSPSASDGRTPCGRARPRGASAAARVTAARSGGMGSRRWTSLSRSKQQLGSDLLTKKKKTPTRLRREPSACEATTVAIAPCPIGCDVACVETVAVTACMRAPLGILGPSLGFLLSTADVNCRSATEVCVRRRVAHQPRSLAPTRVSPSATCASFKATMLLSAVICYGFDNKHLSSNVSFNLPSINL